MWNSATREAPSSPKVPVGLNGQSQKEVDKSKAIIRLAGANRRFFEAKRKLKASSQTAAKFQRSDGGSEGTVARVQRKVFSTGYFAKKLKRFREDSPSASSRRVSQGISIVDLCSSDEDDDGGTIGKVPKDPEPRKGPPLKNENNGFADRVSTNKVATIFGTKVGKAKSENLKRKSFPEVNLCMSSSSGSDGDDDDDESFKSSDQATQKFGREGSFVTSIKDAKEAPEKNNTNRSPTGKAYKIPQSWKDFSRDLAKRKSEILDLKNIAGATKRTAAAVTGTGTERKMGASSFGFPSVSSHSFSTDRKRKLLTLLVPKSLSPETIEAENWKVADYFSVSTAFAERFGGIDTKDLKRLARGESLVPEGMVSTKPASKEKALRPNQTMMPCETFSGKKYIESLQEKDGMEEASVPIVGVSVSTDKTSNRAGDKALNLQAKLFPELLASHGMKDDILRKAGIVKEMDENDPSLSRPSQVGKQHFLQESEINDKTEGQKEADVSIGKFEKEDSATEETKAKLHDGYECSPENIEVTKEADGSIGKDEAEGDIAEEARDGHKCLVEKLEDPNEADVSVEKDEKEGDEIEETKSIAQENKEGIAGKRETPKKVVETFAKDHKDGNGIKPTNPEAQDANDFDSDKTEGWKETDETVESTVVSNENEEHSAQMPRGLVAKIMENIVDTVNSRCSQENDQHTNEIETDIMNCGMTNHGELTVGPSSEVDLSVVSQDKDKDKEEREDRPMIVISAKQLVILALPLLCIAGIFGRIGLFDISNSILEGCFRTLLQLHILGSLLSPIFKYGAKYPGLVGFYALLMIILASYEASSRTKYTHESHFTIIVQSLLLNVSWVAMWAFGAILKPRPVWNPRYLLPIVGMLLGNSINGISITLNTITTSLVENQSEVDLYLSFGADQYEAVSGIVAHAIQKGTTPSLNMMCVVGIVSIPGMMTGQILGGSSPIVAARYQAMIIFLIALSTLSTIMCSSCLTIMSAFCSHQILRPDRFVKNHKRDLARLILWVWGYVFGSGSDPIPVGLNRMPDGNGGGLVTEEEIGFNLRSPVIGFDIRPLKTGLVASDGERRNNLIQASGLNRYFEVRSEIESDVDHRRVLFEDLSFSVNEGDLMLVSGPSGTGKSQLLRMLAGLSPLQDGEMQLQGRNWEDYNGKHVVNWRKQIRYVTQTKVQVPGTPFQFIKKILSFQSWKDVDDRNDVIIEHDFMKHVSHHIRQWGMDHESLNKEWSILSGGESQRVLMAIALASRPKILLFDESTSALDNKSKLAVETSIRDFVADHEGGVLWVSHDEQQVARLMDHLESDGFNID